MNNLIKFLIGLNVALLFAHHVEASDVVIVIDYKFEQNCDKAPVCFGYIDFIGSFDLESGSNQVLINTTIPSSCSQDGMFYDSFEQVYELVLNGVSIGTIKNFEYHSGNGILRIETHELNFNCYDSLKNPFNDLAISHFW